MSDILIIVVLYNQSVNIVNKWKRYVNDRRHLFFCFIDNSENACTPIEFSNSAYLANKKNIGIAAAQNLGIKYAQKNNYKYAIFFDQDSDVDDLYVERMKDEYVRIKERNHKIAILGPTVINKESSLEYKNNDLIGDYGFALAPQLISSGSITEVSNFEIIGLMDELLFIDYVDFEWCWRAEKLGFLCARTHNVFLNHKVGQTERFFFKFPIIVSASTRYFYQYRNFIWLLKRSYVPKDWKKKVIVRKFFEVFFIPWIVPNKIQTIKNIMRGIVAGVSK